jgi:hypothetical protein
LTGPKDANYAEAESLSALVCLALDRRAEAADHAEKGLRARESNGASGRPLAEARAALAMSLDPSRDSERIAALAIDALRILEADPRPSDARMVERLRDLLDPER